MKRILLYLTIFLLLTGCASNKETKSYIEIDYKEYQQKLENKETFALYIGSATCSHCQDLKPILEKVITNYDLEIYYIDLNKLVVTEYIDGNKVVDETKYKEVWNTSNLTGTPTIVFVSDGKIKLFPRIVGAVSESVLIDKLKSAGYIR